MFLRKSLTDKYNDICYQITVECSILNHSSMQLRYDNLISVGPYKSISFSGRLADSNNHTIEMGQISGSLKNFRQTIKIAHLWEQCHANDLIPGTILQMDAIKDLADKSYDNVTAHLITLDLFIDRWYKYASQWLVKVIPDKTIKEIINWFDPVQMELFK